MTDTMTGVTAPGETHRQRINVRQFVDAQPLSRYQIMVVSLCTILLAIEGFDAQAMAFVAPAVARQLHITKLVLGPVLASSMFGMMIGALLFGPIADRIGRKPVLICCAIIAGVGALLTAAASTLHWIMIFRLLTGFGVGGAMPNGIALTAEYMPSRFRATGVTILFCGYSVGGAFGGFVAAALISRFGWPAVFFVGGILPLLAAIIIWAALPESFRFLLIKGGQEPKVLQSLARISPAAASFQDPEFVLEEKRASKIVVNELFTNGRAKLTLSLWIMFFCSLLDLHFLYSWLPILMNDAGIQIQRAIVLTTLLQAGGVLGALTLGRIIDRKSSYRALAWSYAGAAVFIFCIGLAGVSIGLLVTTIFAAGFCVIGCQIGSNTLAAEVYPTQIRSTGVGWALGIGRIGSMVGPLVGGVLLSLGGKPQRVFWVAAIPALIACAAALLIAAQLARRKLAQSKA